MAFKRREGLLGGGITSYADRHFHHCPFCGSNNPHWLLDSYIAKYSLVAALCENGYKFQCEKCGGVLEVRAHNDFCFQTENFISTHLVSAGHGTFNKDLIGKPLTLEKLKNICSGVQPQPSNPVYTQPQQSYNPNPQPAPQPAKNVDIYAEVKKLKELLDAGVLTQEEFNEQKKKILAIASSQPVQQPQNTYVGAPGPQPQQPNYNNSYYNNSGYNNRPNNGYNSYNQRPQQPRPIRRPQPAQTKGAKTVYIISTILGFLGVIISMALLITGAAYRGGSYQDVVKFSYYLDAEYVAWCFTTCPIVSIICAKFILNRSGEGKGLMTLACILLGIIVILDIIATVSYSMYLY